MSLSDLANKAAEPNVSNWPLVQLALVDLANHAALMVLAGISILVVALLLWYGKLKLNWAGVELDSRKPEAAKLQSEVVSESKDAIQKMADLFAGSVINEEKERLKKLVETETNELPKKLEILLSIAAVMSVQSQFDHLYKLIFGAQIVFLKNVNSSYSTEEPQARQWYSGMIEKEKRYSDLAFEKFVSFLVNQGLLHVGNQDGAKVFSTTEKGKAFLVFLINRNYTEYKEPY